MRPFRRSLILVTSLALMPLAGVASAGQARPRSAPPSQGSTQGSSSSGSSSSGSSSSSEQGRSRTQAQPRERESAPPPQQQPQPQQSQRQEQQREREQQSQRQQQQYEQRQQQNEQRQQQNDRRNENGQRQDNSRQAIPAPRDRYIDLNRDGRNDNRDSRVLGPQDRRDLERRNDNRYESRYDGRYDRYDNRYSSYSPYRYDGPRIVFAPRESVRFSRPWFSFRPLIRLPFGLTLGVATPFPSWYRPYIVGRPGYMSPYMPYGGVTFDIEPRDAELWIDGEYVGRASDYSYNDPPLTLVAGSHYVELRSRYGRPLAFDITVIPGQVIPYQGTLPYYR